MNIRKHAEFFNPETMNEVHIIGCGAIGSTVAEMLARIGVPSICLWDMDTVDEYNITNQMYRFKDINKPKVLALADILLEINPDLEVRTVAQGYRVGGFQMPIQGYVFLCVDNIDLRREIVEENLDNPNIKAMFDFRMELTSAQHYAADWGNHVEKTKLLKTMQFSQAEAVAATPLSACGTTLSINPTVRTIVSLGITNCINFINKRELKTLIMADPFAFFISAY